MTYEELLPFLKLKPLFLKYGHSVDRWGNIKALQRFKYLVKVKGVPFHQALEQTLFKQQ